MKIAFSTLACLNSDWAEVCAMAKDVGFDGIEIGNALYHSHERYFSGAEIDRTKERLHAMRLAVSCFSSEVCVCRTSDFEKSKADIVRVIETASRVGAPYVQILGDHRTSAGEDVDDQTVIRRIRELIPAAEKHGVTLLIETNGVYADSARLRNVLEQLASDSVAALWDLHHPYRLFGESPEETVQNLGAYIRYVHMKDSVVEDGVIRYKLVGKGDLPIDDMMMALRSINYDGYLSLEWAERWSDDFEDTGIVVLYFANYMNQFTGKSDSLRSELFDNRAKTGKYIWEKESLIDLTFPQLLDRVVEEFPDQCAFRYTTLDYTRSYREFRDDVDTFARSLISLGVKKGDKVAIWATNVPAWFITFWAATKIGAILVTVNTAYKIHEAEYLLRQSDTHTLVMIEGHKDSDYAGIIREICPELAGHTPGAPLHTKRLPFLRNVISSGFHLAGALTWEEAQGFAEKTPIDIVYQRMATINRHDVCNMQYTSGTTGFPKGVMLTHYNVVNNGKNIGDRMELSTADRFLIHVPMFHCFGMVLSMTASITHGSTMVPIPSFSPRLALEAIHKEEVTACNGVPTMFIAMLEHENFPRTDFSHMRTGIMAGSPCPVKVMQDVIEKMNMSEITIVFGQTESSPGCTQSNSDDSVEVKVGTVGQPLPGIECKIVNHETGEELGDDMDGEFCARGYNIMKGYYKMPAATAAAIDRDGWLHTGDMARRRPDGNYKITGRIRDMIIRGGENIYPKEIEDFIYTHDSVRDVQVIGVPDKQYGEEIMACVVLKEDVTASEEDIRDFVRTHMAKHKTPKYVRFVDGFPMNAAGKILKYKMVEDAIEMLNLTEAKNIETA